MGFRSGEYCGRYRSVAPRASIASRTPGTLWAARPSMITMCPRLRVGARQELTYARNVFPFIGPSVTNGAVIPRRRSAPTNVIVFQCPCGTRPIRRSPRGQRPFKRAIFVLAAVSSMNTRRVESSMCCARFQRLRARATSGRSCSAARRLFFERDLVAPEEAPDGCSLAGNLMLAHDRDDLIERQIRLLRDKREQESRVFLQRRGAAAERLGRAASGLVKKLHPFDRSTRTDVEMFGRLASRRASLDASNHPRADICRIGLRHCSPSQRRINADRLTHPPAPGNPSILPSRNML